MGIGASLRWHGTVALSSGSSSCGELADGHRLNDLVFLYI